MATPGSQLHSERHGRPRSLSKADLVVLLWRRIARLRDQDWLFKGSLLPYRGLGPAEEPPEIRDAEEFLTIHLKISGLGHYLLHEDEPPLLQLPTVDLMVDLIELLFVDVVALPLMVHPPEDTAIEAFDREGGQVLFRESINELLALASPPLELLATGHVVEKSEDHGDLYVEPVPERTEPELRDPVEAAVAQFRRPRASMQDRRAAVKHLADVLERIRDDVDEQMLRKDERDLFRIANTFAIRHYDRQQQSEYDKDVWLDWAFHVFLATIRAVLSVRGLNAGEE